MIRVDVLSTETATANGSQFTVYVLRVRTPTGTHQNKKRYRELREFKELIERNYPSTKKGKHDFPPKRLFGNLSPEVVNFRRDAITNYFQEAFTIAPDVLNSAEFRDFFPSEAKAQSKANSSPASPAVTPKKNLHVDSPAPQRHQAGPSVINSQLPAKTQLSPRAPPPTTQQNALFINKAAAPAKTFSSGDRPPDCSKCGKPCPGKSMTAGGKHFHYECFICQHCRKNCMSGYVEKDGYVYCQEDYVALFSLKCTGCLQAITNDHIVAEDRNWHKKCFVCHKCRRPLDEYVLVGAKFMCNNCA
eukprot:TRINITY_DN3525_c0_g8_i1.p1 TRINITY_DN3525_c0_g8~~TRINITY_DN3525_c0_g8_i1.p1  ORF type:complete len:303 (+),score=76.24 TRINITY_DN3525_c0_g8_i1:57-965(+)